MSKKFVEVSLEGEDAQLEILSAWLAEFGFDAFQYESNRLFCYIEEDRFSEKAMWNFLKSVGLKDKFKCTISRYPDKNWNAKWESEFRPLTIKDQLYIRAPFHEKKEGITYEIVMAPKMAFGTGHHESTRLVLGLMCETIFAAKGKSVLDYGCGTAILAIFAELLGAQYLKAIDNHPGAIENALENIELNRCSKISTDVADITDLKDEKPFDIVLANITRNVIVRSIKSMKHLLKPSGTLIVSGFLSKDEALIDEALTQEGFTFVASETENEWIAAVYKNQ